MNRLLIFSLLVLVIQTTVSAEDQTHSSSQWDSNKVIQRLGSDKRSEESFDVYLGAIKRVLEKDETLDLKKLGFLSDWVQKLSNAQ